MEKNNTGLVIGIDFVTTKCCVGFVEDNRVKFVQSQRDDETTTPSYVYFRNGQKIVGKTAEVNAILHPEAVVYDVKRMIGRSYLDKNIQKNLKHWKFVVEESLNCGPIIKIKRNVKGSSLYYTPEDVYLTILRSLKENTERYTGKKVRGAVITVPAYFNYNQRSATQKAAEKSGLKVLQILNEPTSAALAFVDLNYKNDFFDKTVLVYDLGGGTFDTSIVRIKKDESGENYEILASSGDTYLGGRDFDNNLSDLIQQKLKKKGVRIRKAIKRRVAAQVNGIKTTLSEMDEMEFILNRSFHKCVINISREEFERVNINLFERTIDIVESCLADAKLKASEIDEIVLVGGSSKIPKIRQMLKNVFKNIILSETVCASEAVAYGAARRAFVFDSTYNKAIMIAEVTTLSIGLKLLGGKMIVCIKRNTRVPVCKEMCICTTSDARFVPRDAILSLYEGECLLVKNNRKLGDIVIDASGKPLYTPINIKLEIDQNGILQMSAEIDSKLYKNLKIQYENVEPAKANNVIEQSRNIRELEEKELRVINATIRLFRYSERILTLCNNCPLLSGKQKKIMKDLVDRENYCDQTTMFSSATLSSNSYLDIHNKLEKLKKNCDPFLKKFNLNLELPDGDFHKLLLRWQDEN